MLTAALTYSGVGQLDEDILQKDRKPTKIAAMTKTRKIIYWIAANV